MKVSVTGNVVDFESHVGALRMSDFACKKRLSVRCEWCTHVSALRMRASRPMARTKKKSISKKSSKSMNGDEATPETATASPANDPRAQQKQHLLSTLKALQEQVENDQVVGLAGIIIAPNMLGQSMVAGHVTPQSVALQLQMLQQQIVGAAIAAERQARGAPIV